MFSCFFISASGFLVRMLEYKKIKSLHDLLISLEANCTWHRYYGCLQMHRRSNLLCENPLNFVYFPTLNENNRTWFYSDNNNYWTLNNRKCRTCSWSLVQHIFLSAGHPIRVFLWPMPICRDPSSQWLINNPYVVVFFLIVGQHVGKISFFLITW